MLPAHDCTETVRDDVNGIFEQLDGEKKGPVLRRRGGLGEVRWHVAVCGLDDFPQSSRCSAEQAKNLLVGPRTTRRH